MPTPTQAPAGTTQIVSRILADPVRMFLPSDYWNRARDFFVWNLDYNTVALGAIAQTDAFTQQNDSDFLLLGINAHATTTAAGTTEQALLNFLVSIQDSGSGQNWFGGDDGGFGHAMNIFGGLNISVAGDKFPGWLEYPRFIPAASTVTVSVTNLDAANARRLFVSFRGIKIYRSVRSGQ